MLSGLEFCCLALSAVLSWTSPYAWAGPVPPPVVCQGTQESDFSRSSSVQILRSMRNLLLGCQIVIGDLHLVHIREQEFIDTGSDFSLAFLDTIEEVTGCVKIVNNCFRAGVIFRSLRVIRGASCRRDAVSIWHSGDCGLPQPDAIFAKLAYIANGNVCVAGARGACHLERRVNYTELFHSPDRQRLIVDIPCVGEATDCHRDCPAWPDGSRHCWGPGPDHCQRRTRCWELPAAECPSGRCHLDSVSERCCAEQCLGGCHGTSASQCLACASFNKSGVCVGACNPGVAVYDTNSAAFARPTDASRQYPLGPVCVAECPPSYLTQEGACVSRCSEGFAPNSDGACAPTEAGRACKQRPGQSARICDPSSPLLAAGNDTSLLCSHYTGDLSIMDDCIIQSAQDTAGYPKLTVDQLHFYLSRLTAISGSLTIILDRQTNLSFLDRLRRIDTRPGRAKDQDGSIGLKSSSLRFLGLASLQHVAGQIFAVQETVLCPSLLPTRRTFTDGLVTLGANLTGIDRLDKIRQLSLAKNCPACHPECDPTYGCWGPGPGLCVRCRRYRLPADESGIRGVCVANCEDVGGGGGWYDAGKVRLASSTVSERQCSRCHALCAACSGPGQSDCTKCAPSAYTDADTGACSTGCSIARQFADADRVCRPCSDACAPSIDESNCTGNLSVVGEGGCSFCTKVLEPIDDDAGAMRCLQPLAACPDGYELRMLESDQTARRRFAWRRRRPHSLVSICRRRSRIVESGDELTRLRLAREARLAAAYISAGVLVVALLASAVAAFHCLRRRAVRQAAVKAAVEKRRRLDASWDDEAEPSLNAFEDGLFNQVQDEGSDDPAGGIAVLRTISEKELVRGAEIGSGAFGTVYRGEWLPEASSDRQKLSVAIKILADSTDIGGGCLTDELLAEGRIMASVRHRHCLSLVGVCMTQPPQLISRFLPLGNLRDFLRARRGGAGQLGGGQLLRFAAQIASGMAYLERRSVIHRDLACRNVLVASPGCVKITDFGLARLMDNPNQEYQASGGKLPIKWLALECLISRRFSHKSDVWAYGVTLWEIFTFGEPPYPGVKPVDLADYLEKGERLPQPPICTLDVYILMIKCWMLNESQRPGFDELEASFRRMYSAPSRYVCIKGDRLALSSTVSNGQAELAYSSLEAGEDEAGLEPHADADELLRMSPPPLASAESYSNAPGGVSSGGQARTELQPLLSGQQDDYLEPIKLDGHDKCSHPLNNPEYFFNASRHSQAAESSLSNGV